jgi:hypothetical protein
LTRSRRALQALLLVCVSSAVTFTLLEGIFRILDLRGHHSERRTVGVGRAVIRDAADRLPGVRPQLKPGSSFGIFYDSDPRGYYGPERGLVYHMNRWGFRGPDFALAPEPGVRRIALLGDSFTFGEGVRFEDTLGEQLERLLSSDGSAVEVLPFAVGNWSTADEIRFLEQRGMDFAPDLVVVVYVLNDAETSQKLDLWQEFRRRYESRSFARSYFASWVYARLARRELARRYVEQTIAAASADREAWQRSMAYLARGREIARAGGAGFAVAVYPFLYELDATHPFRGLHQQVVGFCRSRGIAVLDLLDAFDGQDHAALWAHPSDQHPNERAHAIAADALARFIRDTPLRTPAP